VTHHHRGDVIYFCLHRGQFALKHCKTASPHSIKRLECVRENSARRQREPTERPQTNYLTMKRKSMNTRIRSGIIFLSVCVLVGLVAFFAGAHAQVATQSPGATATPARTAAPVRRKRCRIRRWRAGAYWGCPVTHRRGTDGHRSGAGLDLSRD